MRVAPIAVAVAVAGVTAWRWRRSGWRLRCFGVAVFGALVLYGAGIAPTPRFEHVIASVGSTLGPYTYVLVGVMAFLETGAFVGLVVPGETIVIVGGVVAGQGHVDLWVLLALTWLCAFAGDVTGYLLGRRLGRRFLLARGARVHITEARLLRVEAFFGSYGAAAILIGRFVGLVRAVAPFLAGASRYPLGRFVALAGLGSGLWSGAFVLLGYLFWQSLDQAIAIAKRGSLALGGIIALVIALIAGYRFVRQRASAASLAEPPVSFEPPRTDVARSDGAPSARHGADRPRSASSVGLRVRSRESD